MPRSTRDFPTHEDLTHLSYDNAQTALDALRLVVNAGLASVYTRPFTPEGQRPRWNVWLDRAVWPVGEQRIELATWASAYIETLREEQQQQQH